MKTWAEVAQDPQFRGLPVEAQEAARQQYFSEVVAPRVPAHFAKEARFQFDRDTKGSIREMDSIDRSAVEAQRPNALERFGRGFADITQGVKQLALQGKDAVTGSNDAAAYTREKTDELARYDSGRGPDAGVDWMRIGGNVAATAPAMLIPGAGAAGMGARVASGAAQGAVSSGAMFTAEGDSKLAQTLLGAGIGGAVPVAVQAVKRAVQSAASSIPTGGTISLPNLRGQIEIELRQQGIDFNRLTREVQKSLLDDAQNVLRTGMDLDPTQLARKADIEAVGARGTRAAVTRNPKDWRTMQNLRGVDNAGEGIAARQSGDAQAMGDYLSALRANTGSKATTAFEAGEAPIKALQAADAARNTVVDDLYAAYRGMGQQDAAVPATRVADVLGRVADEIGVENIPSPVLGRLKEFGLLGGTQTKLLTINEADKLNKLINNNNPGRGTPGARALQPIKEALNDALLDIPEEGASKALLTARRSAADMFAERRASSGVEAAIGDVAPDKFVQRFIINAPVKDMRASLAAIKKTPDGTQAIADIKGHLFDNLLLKATGATSVDQFASRAATEHTFSGRNFAKALDAIAPEKLHAIFTPSEIDSLRTLQRASKYLTEEVPFSDVNHSKTAAAMANLLAKIGQTPMLGGLLSPILGTAKIGMDWVKDAAQRRAVAEMLLTSAGRPGQAIPAQLAAPGKLAPLAPGAAAAVLTGTGNQQADR